MTTQSWTRDVAQLAQGFGATVGPAQNGHLRITGDGWEMGCPKTPRDPGRTLKNLKARMKRKVKGS